MPCSILRTVMLGGFLVLLAAPASQGQNAPARQDGSEAGVPRRLPGAAAQAVGMRQDVLNRIDAVAAEGLRRKLMPGCVVLVARRQRVVFHRAYGSRSLQPAREPMTPDTIFDLASLTKPLSTATSVMKLVEQGKIELGAPVARYIPEFAANGKADVTVLQLLTHQGGLIPDNSIRDYDDGAEQAMKKIFALPLYVQPGTKFVYTDVGYIVLAEVVRRVSGLDVARFAAENVYRPLGMLETGFVPASELRARVAPTEQREGKWMRGDVHDPRAYRLGGIAGHAGLFSTARDLAIYAAMMKGGGAYLGTRILDAKTVELMTQPWPIADGTLRGLGWDKRSGYSYNGGDLLSPRAFGHGGFTGTVLWIDPELDLTFVFLSNRVHPDGKGSVNRLAARMATLAAASIVQDVSPVRAEPVECGVDVLRRNEFAALAGRRVGLITNHTGVAADGVSTVRLLHEAANVRLVALFSPEHGFAGTQDVSKIANAEDSETGLRIFSLYGETRTPTADMLQGVDTLVFDIQDIGTRFYTYISTMRNAMEAASHHGLKFVVLDRPNPIDGVTVSGPVLDAGSESFVGAHTLPVRHGMTVGEIARMLNAELRLGLDLEIVPITHWSREMLLDETGLTWINPSPNMRSLTQAVLYPGVGLLETTNISVGRGTDTPFEVIGAPWMDGRLLAADLAGHKLPGVRFVPIRFTPRSSKHAGVECGGVNLIVTSRAAFEPLRTGIAIARVLRSRYAAEWETSSLNRLLANQETAAAILEARPVSEIVNLWEPDLRQFLRRREEFLLYTNPAAH